MCTRSVRVQASLDCATGKPAEVDMHIKQAGWLAQPLGSAVWMPVAFSCICCFVAVGLVHSMGIFRSVPSVSCHRVLVMPYASLLHCLPSHRHDGTAYQHLRARCVQCRRLYRYFVSMVVLRRYAVQLYASLGGHCLHICNGELPRCNLGLDAYAYAHPVMHAELQ